jgi:hypothetical protein
MMTSTYRFGRQKTKEGTGRCEKGFYFCGQHDENASVYVLLHVHFLFCAR